VRVCGDSKFILQQKTKGGLKKEGNERVNLREEFDGSKRISEL